MKTGLSLSALAAEIEARANQKKDFIAPMKKLEMDVKHEDGKAIPVLAINNGTRTELVPNKVAHEQIAEHAGIPAAYYRRMVEEAPELLVTNVNRWWSDKVGSGERRMVRTLGNTARALLSDKYRPLENEDLAQAVLPVLLDMDLMIMSSQITETRLYIKAVDRSIEKDVPTGRKIGDGSHVFFDTCSPAIVISNSEVGHGALSIETGVYTKVCTNLAMIGSNLRKYHTGSRAAVSDEVYALLSDKTRQMTDAAIWNQVRDLVKSSFEQSRFDTVLAKLQGAAQDRIEDDVVEVVERAGKKFNLLQGERKGILQRLIEGGDLTRYGLHSAITRHAEDVEDYDRATVLERVGGEVIELPRNQWEAILE